MRRVFVGLPHRRRFSRLIPERAVVLLAFGVLSLTYGSGCVSSDLDSFDVLSISGKSSVGVPADGGTDDESPEPTPPADSFAGAVLELTLSSASATAGVALDATITVKDGNGQVISDYTGIVTFTSDDSQAVLGMSQYEFVAADAGVKTLTGLVEFRTTGTWMLTVSRQEDTEATASAGALVAAGPASEVVVTGPTSAAAGSAFTATLTAYDTFGNLAASFNGTVSLLVTDSDGSTNTYSSVSISSGAGTATISITRAGGASVSITSASDPSLDITDAHALTISPAAAMDFAVSGARIINTENCTAYSIAFQDQYGNAGAALASPLTLSLSGTGGGTAYQDGLCSMSGMPTFASGATSGSFYFKTGTPETVVLQLTGMVGTSSVTRTQAVASYHRVRIAVGAHHFCALRDGDVDCWGSGEFGQIGDGSTSWATATRSIFSSGVADIAAGANHVCALMFDGTVQCWGRNHRGQIGNGSSGTDVSSPTAVSGLPAGVTGIAAGKTHNCATKVEGTSAGVYCWGSNEYGEIGNNPGTNTSDVPTATLVHGGLAGAVHVAAGDAYSCAVLNGGVQCWGRNDSGQLGFSTGGAPQKYPGTAIATDLSATHVAAGGRHTCAILGGTLMCWGSDDQGQLGLTSGDDSTASPTSVSSLSLVTDISLGADHSCAVATGAVYCWGRNFEGQSGNADRAIPVQQPQTVSLASPQSVVLGWNRSCAADTSGNLHCWGHSSHEEFLNATAISDKREPVATAYTDLQNSGSGSVSKVVGGKVHSCALMSNGTAKCWGANMFGQLGNGSTTSSLSPLAVLNPADTTQPLSGLTDIVAGAHHTCAMTSTGAVYCWGRNNYGQLGTGNTTNRLLPASVSISNAFGISAGQEHTCALIDDLANSQHDLRCWGSNSYGQIGGGTSVGGYSTAPILVSEVLVTTETYSGLSAGASHNCLLSTDAFVATRPKCWGRNVEGQLGDGTTTGRTTPTAVSAGSISNNIAIVAAGGSHTCAVDSVNGLHCWGANTAGQLGNGSTTGSNAPVAVSTSETPSAVGGIALGDQHTCAILTLSSGQDVYCWGTNADGQIGAGSGKSAGFGTPKAVVGGASPSGIGAGLRYSCAIYSDGLHCWGANLFGQLANGSSSATPTPQLVAP